jgi:hypothetical protein
MSDTTTNKPFRKWAMRGFMLFAVLMLGMFTLAIWLGSRTQSRLDAFRSKLDQDDPGWRFEEIKARRKAALPVDKENITLRMMHLREDHAKTFNTWLSKNENWLPREPRTGLPTPQALADAKKLKLEIQETLDEVLATQTLTSGGHVPDVGLGLDLTPLQQLRLAAGLLRFQAQIQLADNQPENAATTCLALLNLANGLNESPLLVNILGRCAICAVATDTLERVLATTDPKSSLPKLQAAYAQDNQAAIFATVLRGERAYLDANFNELNQVGFLGSLVNRLSPLRLGDQHLEGLEMRTRELELVRGPSHEWLKKFRDMPKPDPSKLLIAPLVTNDEKAIQAVVRTNAKLNSMVIAIACERFRLANGRWPKSLAEIPKTLLAEPPTDPYTGQPLRFTTTPTGIKVYAVGRDETDDGGNLSDDAKPGTDLGVELWSPEHRRK